MLRTTTVSGGWLFCLSILVFDTSVSIPNGIVFCALYVLLSNIWPQPDYARFTSTKPAKAGFVPGGHSSPGLKAWGFLADFIKLEDSYNKLEELSITDKLTNLYNRRYFDEALEREVLRARRLQHALSLLFIDIDKFKHFNDTYGHPEGDKVLQRLGQIIKERARNGVDVACRYGGEEFVVLLPEIAGRGAITVATRMLRDFGNTKFFIQPNDETVQKTISIGIAELGLSTDAKALLANADSAMYEAKKSGGNTVCLHHKA